MGSDSALSTQLQNQQCRFTGSDGFDASWNPYQIPYSLKNKWLQPRKMFSPTHAFLISSAVGGGGGGGGGGENKRTKGVYAVFRCGCEAVFFHWNGVLYKNYG